MVSKSGYLHALFPTNKPNCCVSLQLSHHFLAQVVQYLGAARVNVESVKGVASRMHEACQALLETVWHVFVLCGKTNLSVFCLPTFYYLPAPLLFTKSPASCFVRFKPPECIRHAGHCVPFQLVQCEGNQEVPSCAK